jgi:L-amino acid N-acyltransferase YncA
MITIRSMKESDLPETLTIYNDIIVNTTAVYTYVPQTLQMRRDWYESKLKDGYPVFIAESEGRVVGFSSFGPFRAWPAYKYTVENSVYVAADQRGRGIGKLLMEPVISAAKEKQLHAIVSGIDASNTASIQLHRSFGFEIVAQFKQVGFKFGQWLDLTFMELILDTPVHPVEE